MGTHGVVYAATGSEHVKEAVVSARSLRLHMPHVPILLFTDIRFEGDAAIDEVRRIENPSFSFTDKIRPLLDLPFDRTLFLDSDTWVCRSFPELFDLLDRFEVVAAHDPWRLGPIVPVPDSFPEMNTGVLLLKKTDNVTRLVANWLQLHLVNLDRDPLIGDQAASREVVYHSQVQFYSLSSEYNFRTYSTNFAGKTGVVKILHGNQYYAKQLASLINCSSSFRVFLPAMSCFSSGEVIVGTRSGRLTVRTLQSVNRLWGLMKRAQGWRNWNQPKTEEAPHASPELVNQ